jgi:hypothetical protein
MRPLAAILDFKIFLKNLKKMFPKKMALVLPSENKGILETEMVAVTYGQSSVIRLGVKGWSSSDHKNKLPLKFEIAKF